jgi:hypothetical protein
MHRRAYLLLPLLLPAPLLLPFSSLALYHSATPVLLTIQYSAKTVNCRAALRPQLRATCICGAILPLSLSLLLHSTPSVSTAVYAALHIVW